MRREAILAVDQGTTNTKALLVTPDGTILDRASRPMTLAHPHPDWSEQSAEAIWASVAGTIGDLVARAIDTRIVGVAISNQRETMVLWETASGRPLAPAISWQCRRAADRCAALRAAGHAPLVIERTGLPLDPLLPATKLAWLLDSLPGTRARAARGELRVGTVDSWLLWNLTGGAVHATNHGNAARTQLLDLDRLQWDGELAHLFGVPMTLLPELRASDSCFGSVAAGRTALPEGVPIHAVMGDSHAALFGHGIREIGAAKVTIGTGSSIMALADRSARSVNGLARTVAWSRQGGAEYAFEGNIAVSGQAAAFATRMLGLADEEALSALARSVDDSGGVVFVPALAGIGAPHWKDEARGLLSGMTLGTTPARIARAVLEAIAMQIVDVYRAMEADVGATMPVVSVDGGATCNDLLMQMLADLLDRTVARCADAELSALGVAAMAAEALGLATQQARPETSESFVPTMSAERRDQIHHQWAASVALAAQRS